MKLNFYLENAQEEDRYQIRKNVTQKQEKKQGKKLNNRRTRRRRRCGKTDMNGYLC